MCDTEISDDDSAFNKAGVNDPTKENFNPHAMIWIQRPDGFLDAMHSTRTQNKGIANRRRAQ